MLPIIGPKIKDEVEKAKASVRKNKDLYNPSYVLELPAKSKTVDEMKLIIQGTPQFSASVLSSIIRLS